MGYSVGEVARLAGVTVRTLHHYDEIGLLSPVGRSAAGYRQYDIADLERLQRIRSYRELGFDLERIAAILDDPTIDPLDHLRAQHALLNDRIGRLQEMVTALERLMEARQMGIDLTPDEMFEVFGDFDPTEYADEAEERWGDTDAYRQSVERTARYTKDDWKRITEETGGLYRRIADAMEAGVPADSDEAMDLAEGHRQQISRYFYDCSHEVHRGLGEMYVADQRFTANIDATAPGLAAYLRDAIAANAERAAS